MSNLIIPNDTRYFFKKKNIYKSVYLREISHKGGVN